MRDFLLARRDVCAFQADRHINIAGLSAPQINTCQDTVFVSRSKYMYGVPDNLPMQHDATPYWDADCRDQHPGPSLRAELSTVSQSPGVFLGGQLNCV